ncbi:MAG TPA: HAMP domain-containing sensor histidine kinase, partial [Armatimonadota bacterium]|nr:HAMP domain-containing sensor histidine kinase [Armatimonadota bacterium]
THFKLAIISDPGYDSALHNLCRVWYDQPNEVAVRQIRALMDVVPDEAPDVIGHIIGHLVDVAKADAYASTYDKAHEIKNLIAILGARMRKSLSAEACSDATDLHELMDLHGRAFEAIRGYLNAIHVDPGEKETLDCGDVLRKCLRQLVVTKPEGVAVSNAIGTNLPPLRGDRKRLMQLFRNLVVNAFEVMPDGGSLNVAAEAIGRGSTRPGETVRRGIRICFQDSGPGMSEEELRRAFDPGYTTKERGPGYGLAVVSQIVREHGGTISLETVETGGLRVTVELPERVQPEAASERLRLRPVIFEDWRRLVQAELDAIGPSDGSSARRSDDDDA